MSAERPPLTPEEIALLAAASGLTLSRARAQELVPHVVSFLEVIARLRRIDVSRYEPALIFSGGQRRDRS